MSMKVFDIIKYEGPNDVLIWKYPGEDFNTLSQLIVHETQEAIFFKDGRILDSFGPGNYTLHSQNIPLIRHLVNLPFNGESPFHCEVYFVNKVVSMDVKWETPSPIPIQDAVYKIILPVSAYGQFGVQVADSRRLLIRLVGTLSQFDQNTLLEYFRGILLTNIKDYIAAQFARNKISFLEIHSHLRKISDGIAGELSMSFSEYGLMLAQFNVIEISPPEQDPSYIRLKEALAKKAEMAVMGYSYQQERTFDILDRAAANEGSSSTIMGAGLGLSMGTNIGSIIGGVMGGIASNIQPDTPSGSEEVLGVPCSNCGKVLPPKTRYCLSCGQKIGPDIEEGQVKCPNCANLVPKGKFCMECGYKLQQSCPKCGAELIPGAKFCMGCGLKVE